MVKKQVLFAVFFILLAAGCNQPDEALSIATPTTTPTGTPIPTAATSTATPTETLIPTAMPTASPTATYTPTPLTQIAACSFEDSTFYNWHYQPLDRLSEQVQTALDTAGITRAKVSAIAYGENEISQSTGQICGFGAMETDFTVMLQTDGLTDSNELGTLIEEVLIVLDEFPPDATPGPMSGYITINFTSADQSQNSLRFWFADGVEVRERGLQGMAMLEALGYRQ